MKEYNVTLDKNKEVFTIQLHDDKTITLYNERITRTFNNSIVFTDFLKARKITLNYLK